MNKTCAIIGRFYNGKPIIWNGIDSTIRVPSINVIITGVPTIELAMEKARNTFKNWKETPNVIDYVNNTLRV